MENFDFKLALTIAYNIFYTLYICRMLFGGLKDKRIKPLQYVIIIVLLIPFFLMQFDGIQHPAELINLIIILILAIVKGIVLGKRKVVTKIDGIWYMHHDKLYIIIWISILAAKITITQILRVVSGAEMPLWQAIAYFGVYYIVRTTTIFACNPQMAKEIFREKLVHPNPKKSTPKPKISTTENETPDKKPQIETTPVKTPKAQSAPEEHRSPK